MAYKFNPFTGTLDYYVINNSTAYILESTKSTATYTILTSDFNKINYFDFDGDRTVTLPSSPTDGSWVIIADGNRSGFNTNYAITIVAGAGNTIASGISPMASNNQSVQLVYVSSLLQWIGV